MGRPHLKLTLAAGAAFAALATVSSPAGAVEGGSSPYPKGIAPLMAGLLPPPGVYISNYYLYNDGATGAEVRNGAVEFNVSFKLNGDLVFGIDSTDATFLGGRYAFGGAVDYLNAKLHAQIGSPVGGINANLDQTGIGDSLLEPVALGWDEGNLHWSTDLLVYVPTGAYNLHRFNIGKNIWAFMPQFSLTWFDPKSGWDASGTLTYVVMTENTATQYQSGDIIHLELSSGYHFVALGGQWEVGVGANLMEQISPDSGAGAKLGPFEAQSFGIGPAMSYATKAGNTPLIFTGKWEHDVTSRNTLGGNVVYVTTTVVL